MRVGLLLLATGRKAGGPETYEVELVRSLAKRYPETEFFLYTTESCGTLADTLSFANVRIRRLRPSNRWVALSVSIHLYKWRDRIDVLHCTYAPPLFGSGYVFTMHCVSNLRHPEYYGRLKAARLNALQRRGLRHAQQILCVSGFVRDQLVESFGVPREKTHVVYNGVSPAFSSSNPPNALEELARHFGIQAPYLLYVGKLQGRKNLERMIEAYDRFRTGLLESGCIERIQMVLAGRSTEENLHLHATIRSSPFNADILELGYLVPPDGVGRSYLPMLYCNALALVFPSLFEGFGFPLIEAMASGVPVLAADATSLPEIAGDAAILFDPNSVEMMSDSMRKIHGSQALRCNLIELGLQRAAAFTWERCADQTMEAYRRAAGQ